LLAVPKKTKLYGWECSKCVRKKDSDYEDEESLNSSKLESTQRSKRERKPKIRSHDIDIYVTKPKKNGQNKRRSRNANSKPGRTRKTHSQIDANKLKSQNSLECSEADAIYIDDEEDDDEDYDDYIDLNDTNSSKTTDNTTKQNSVKDAFSDESNHGKSNGSFSNKKHKSKRANSDDFEKIIDDAILSTTTFGMRSPKKAKSIASNQ